MSRLLDVAGARTYAGAGVSIEAGDEAVERIKKSVDSTFREGVLGGIGGFGGLFALGAQKYKEPVLVASADGGGHEAGSGPSRLGDTTRSASTWWRCWWTTWCASARSPSSCWTTWPSDLVQPEQVVERRSLRGIAEGCRQAHAALLGGETAEHGGVMKPDDLDVAGFALGVVERR